MIIALLAINKKYLFSIIKFIQAKILKKNVNIETIISKESQSKDLYRKDSIISLAETIEELGFIPSIVKKNNTKAA